MRPLVVWMLAMSGLGCAQTAPPDAACRMESINLERKVAELAGDPVVVFRAEGEWTCGYRVSAKGARPIWVRTAELIEVAVNERPAVREWVGAWTGGDVSIAIRAAGNRLALNGAGSWKGRGPAQSGRFAAEVTPEGNVVRAVDGACSVDLKLFGRFVLANDNGQCGGANVRFRGVLRRTP